MIIWREAGCGDGEEYALIETMRQERRAAEPPRSVSKMQSAVTNGAASRAHRILDAAISAGLAPEGNLTIAERGKGRRNRPYKCGSTVAPFVTAIYQSIKTYQNSAAYTQHSYRLVLKMDPAIVVCWIFQTLQVKNQLSTIPATTSPSP